MFTVNNNDIDSISLLSEYVNCKRLDSFSWHVWIREDYKICITLFLWREETEPSYSSLFESPGHVWMSPLNIFTIDYWSLGYNDDSFNHLLWRIIEFTRKQNIYQMLPQCFHQIERTVHFSHSPHAKPFRIYESCQTLKNVLQSLWHKPHWRADIMNK